MDKKYAKRVLEEFLSFPLSSSEGILRKFAALPGAVACFDGEKRNFVYVPGNRDDRIVLAAHADTVWDRYYLGIDDVEQKISEYDGVYRGVDPDFGLGADDRAGCAMLWLLKDAGHSLLVLDGEEHGQIGANHLKTASRDLFEELNDHSYILQLDRRGKSDYKVYDLPVTKEFIRFIEKETGYKEPDKRSRTDIVALCEKVCGVNLSIGYYDEHRPGEKLVFADWYRTLSIVEKMLEGKQRRFPSKNA